MGSLPLGVVFKLHLFCGFLRVMGHPAHNRGRESTGSDGKKKHKHEGGNLKPRLGALGAAWWVQGCVGGAVQAWRGIDLAGTG